MATRSWVSIADLIVKAAGVIVIPLTIWCLGASARDELWDITLLEKFNRLYTMKSNDESRRLSVALVRRMKDPRLQRELHGHIFWSTMERHFPNKGPFYSEDQDWHLLGEAMMDRWRGDCAGFSKWWDDRKKIAADRWSREGPKIEEVYVYLNKDYFAKVPPKPCPDPR